jgi:hypothetical protein
MRRREFIAGLGSAAAWPLTTWARPTERVRRIGVLLPGDENEPRRSLASPRSSKRLRTWAGPVAATRGWTFGGAAVNRPMVAYGLENRVISTKSISAVGCD